MNALSLTCVLFIGRALAAPEEVKCPCDANPGFLCTNSFYDNNCEFLPKMNFNSMQNQFNDFLVNTDLTPRENEFCLEPNSGPKPIGATAAPASASVDQSKWAAAGNTS